MAFINLNREVVNTKQLGKLRWTETIASDTLNIVTHVDTGGKMQTQTVFNAEAHSVVGTDSGRWVVENTVRIKPGEPIMIERRRSGRRYLCGGSSGNRRCHRIVR